MAKLVVPLDKVAVKDTSPEEVPVVSPIRNVVEEILANSAVVSESFAALATPKSMARVVARGETVTIPFGLAAVAVIVAPTVTSSVLIFTLPAVEVMVPVLLNVPPKYSMSPAMLMFEVEPTVEVLSADPTNTPVRVEASVTVETGKFNVALNELPVGGLT